MKFFSNEAKENESEYDRENSDVVTSEPVAVPQQRAGSPWSDAPASGEHAAADQATGDHATAEDRSPDDELADRERRDGTEEGDSFRRDETSFPGDSLQDDSLQDDSFRRDTDRDDTGRDDTGREDALRRDENDGTGPVDVDLDEPASRREDLDDPASRRDNDDDVASRRDEAGEPEAVTYGPDGTVTPASTDDSAGEATEDALKDEGTFDSPEAVDPATGDKLDSVDGDARDRAEAERDETATSVDTAQTEPVPVAAAATTTDESAAATPGSVPAPALDRLFAEGDSFADRFRDIQLRFVDSPKEATAEAATLVGEAVDKLTSALKAQKDSLAGESDDTEQLRVQLRSYRDLLNRLSAL